MSRDVLGQWLMLRTPSREEDASSKFTLLACNQVLEVSKISILLCCTDCNEKQLFLHLQSGNCEASVDEAGHVVIAAGGTFPLQVLLVASFWKHFPYPPFVSFCEGEWSLQWWEDPVEDLASYGKVFGKNHHPVSITNWKWSIWWDVVILRLQHLRCRRPTALQLSPDFRSLAILLQPGQFQTCGFRGWNNFWMIQESLSMIVAYCNL